MQILNLSPNVIKTKKLKRKLLSFGTQLKTSRSKSVLRHLIDGKPRNNKTPTEENKTSADFVPFSRFERVIINRSTKGAVIVDSCLFNIYLTSAQAAASSTVCVHPNYLVPRAALFQKSPRRTLGVCVFTILN